MSFFHNTRDTTIHFQDSQLTAIGGDQRISGSVAIGHQHFSGHQHFAGHQNNYLTAPLRGALLSFQIVRLAV